MPTQKEVIHLTFGTLAHHVSTHFFNQQSSHFQYGGGGVGKDEEEQGETLVLDPSVDFQEGVGTRRAESTFFPRQVVVDFKDSLGTRWDAYDVVFEEEEEQEEEEREEYAFDDRRGADTVDDDSSVLRPSRAANEGLRAWNAPAEIHRTGRHGKVKSTRVAFLSDDEGEIEASDASEGEMEGQDGQDVVQGPRKSSSRTKTRPHTGRTPADYAHNPFHPRSLRPLPALFEGGALVPMNASDDPTQANSPLATFEMGMRLARHMDNDEALLDEHIRWFAEDSDQMQSFSLCTSMYDGFSGMAHETIQLLADEFPKTSVVAWGADYDIASEAGDDTSRDRLSRLRTTNAVLSLWSLSSASLYTPMRLPTSITQARPKGGHMSSRVNWSDMYNVGAVYAAHFDTATMTSRLHDQRRRVPMSTLVSSLNWRRNTPIALLGGCLPTPLLAPVKENETVLDPIDALLAARGYGARLNAGKSRAIDTPEELAKRAAKRIESEVIDLATIDPRSTLPLKAFAQVVTGRDDDRFALKPTQEALEAWSSLDEPMGRANTVPLAFNIRSASFPQLFRRLTSNGRPLPKTSRSGGKVHTVPMLSALSTTPASAHMLAEARRWIDQTMIKGHAPLNLFGIGGSRGRSGAGQAANDETEGLLGGREGLVEIRERLEELLSAYEEGLPFGHKVDAAAEEDIVGTDEEVEAQEDSDWDLE